MTEILAKPTPPADYECCESGCSPCVWDLYYEQLAQWNQQQATLKDPRYENATEVATRE